MYISFPFLRNVFSYLFSAPATVSGLLLYPCCTNQGIYLIPGFAITEKTFSKNNAIELIHINSFFHLISYLLSV